MEKILDKRWFFLSCCFQVSNVICVFERLDLSVGNAVVDQAAFFSFSFFRFLTKASTRKHYVFITIIQTVHTTAK